MRFKTLTTTVFLLLTIGFMPYAQDTSPPELTVVEVVDEAPSLFSNPVSEQWIVIDTAFNWDMITAPGGVPISPTPTLELPSRWYEYEYQPQPPKVIEHTYIIMSLRKKEWRALKREYSRAEKVKHRQRFRT